MTSWEVHGRMLANCNCDYGCPCQFNALPTHGHCQAAVVWEIDTGKYGEVKLDGLRCGGTYKWPGAVHEGNGEMQLVVDDKATPEQREALEKIMTGQDTDDMATMWWVYSTMAPNRHETVYAPVSASVDIEERTGKADIGGIARIEARPIVNPVTGNPHRARIDMPAGFEYALAEVASGSSTTSGPLALDELNDSHAYFAEMHLSNSGVIRPAA